MTNKEHYASVLIDLLLKGYVAVDKNDKPCNCQAIRCIDCKFGDVNTCLDELKDWFNRTYRGVDWTKVQVDTPVVHEGKVTYFSHYNAESGWVYVFKNGTTSLTSDGATVGVCSDEVCLYK